jgi:hypothetical protein
MNTRIRELAEQAELNATLLFNKEKLEKFAHLIVQETIAEMSQQLHHAGDDQSNNPTYYKAIEKTMKAFGVES